MKFRPFIGAIVFLVAMVIGDTASAQTYSCKTSILPQGTCGLYSYAGINGTDVASAAWVGQNDWSNSTPPVYKSTLYANSPASWKVSVVVSNPSGAVLSFPNAGWYEQGTVDSVDESSAWNIAMPTSPSLAIGWAAYDLWFNNWADEVMIQVDLSVNSNYDCQSTAETTFAGQPWHLCVFGSEKVWKPGTDDSHLRSVASGSIDVRPMIEWLEQHGQIPAGSTWTAASFGFEIPSTYGNLHTFTVKSLTWR